MNTIRDQAYKLGCGRLLFEHGAIAKLGDEVKRLGSRPLVICGKNAHEALGSRICQTPLPDVRLHRGL